MAATATPDSPLHLGFSAHLSALNLVALRGQFEANDEFLTIANFLPAAELSALLGALPALEPCVHRTFIPSHKKGGSISRYELDGRAPAFPAFYRSGALLTFLEALCGRPLMHCPADDPHAYALYYYIEAGDHIGYHYDKSYYKGARYTVLLGLIDESSCRLEYELFGANDRRATVSGAIGIAPGTLVIFNGDKVWHRISPAAHGERRVVLTLEFLTSLDMHPLRRFVSNMKDAIAYFGFRQVFSSAKRR